MTVKEGATVGDLKLLFHAYIMGLDATRRPRGDYAAGHQIIFRATEYAAGHMAALGDEVLLRPNDTMAVRLPNPTLAKLMRQTKNQVKAREEEEEAPDGAATAASAAPAPPKRRRKVPAPPPPPEEVRSEVLGMDAQQRRAWKAAGAAASEESSWRSRARSWA